ncbi:MAG: isoprenylcysteine carboxylmethyltransferase family protein [Methanotrichaceae archaeon]|nr:isoprenylcysteine carboxylmethyltransferase family protein [Methanotrichaceae archaeon]
MASSVLALTGYFVFFAAVHSLLADLRFKNWARRSLGKSFDRFARLAFVILALIMVLPFIYILIFMPTRRLYLVSYPWSLAMAGFQILAALALLEALRQTGAFTFLGLSQLRGTSEKRRLVTDGFYCHLRNPLFLFGALFLWLSPAMTASLLAFNILATAYFYLGARHEERSLREEFGPEYEEYRRSVPMFLPRLKCRPG